MQEMKEWLNLGHEVGLEPVEKAVETYDRQVMHIMASIAAEGRAKAADSGVAGVSHRGELVFQPPSVRIPHHSAPTPSAKQTAWQPGDPTGAMLTRRQQDRLACGLVDRLVGILQFDTSSVQNWQQVRYNLKRAIEDHQDLTGFYRDLGPVYEAAVTGRDWQEAFYAYLHEYPALRDAINEKAPFLGVAR